MDLLLPIVIRFTLFAGCLLAALFRSGVPSPPPHDRAAANACAA
jgi:ABC-type amino acid transport system permease subunit